MNISKANLLLAASLPLINCGLIEYTKFQAKSEGLHIYKKTAQTPKGSNFRVSILNLYRGDVLIEQGSVPFKMKRWTVNRYSRQVISWEEK